MKHADKKKAPCGNCRNKAHGKEGDPLNVCDGANGCYLDESKGTFSNYVPLQRGLFDSAFVDRGPTLYCSQWRDTRPLDYCENHCTASVCLNPENVAAAQAEQKARGTR